MYDVIIIGSGPSGLTSAIYTTRANLKTLLVAGVKWGGQLMLTTEVENFPGFPGGIMGPELMGRMRKQAEELGAEIIDIDFEKGDFNQGGPFKIKAGDKEYEAKSVIIATGADTKWLGVPGEMEHIGRGVSTCAPCDAAFFKEKNVIVVGGGDSAMEEADVLTKFAREVTIVHRRAELRACKRLQDRVKNNPKIKLRLNSQITEILGDPVVKSVKIKNNETGEIKEMSIDGVFVAVGHIPNTSKLNGIELDEKGYIKVHDNSKTNIEGVFVAGDVHDRHYMQAITAAAYGCMAALDLEKWLMEKVEK